MVNEPLVFEPLKSDCICAKVYSEGIQPVKGNNCRLIPCCIVGKCGSDEEAGQELTSRITPPNSIEDGKYIFSHMRETHSV